MAFLASLVELTFVHAPTDDYCMYYMVCSTYPSSQCWETLGVYPFTVAVVGEDEVGPQVHAGHVSGEGVGWEETLWLQRLEHATTTPFIAHSYRLCVLLPLSCYFRNFHWPCTLNQKALDVKRIPFLLTIWAWHIEYMFLLNSRLILGEEAWKSLTLGNGTNRWCRRWLVRLFWVSSWRVGLVLMELRLFLWGFFLPFSRSFPHLLCETTTLTEVCYLRVEEHTIQGRVWSQTWAMFQVPGTWAGTRVGVIWGSNEKHDECVGHVETWFRCLEVADFGVHDRLLCQRNGLAHVFCDSFFWSCAKKSGIQRITETTN